MMDKPIERTVVWDEASDCWRDKVTGVDAKGMGRPLWDDRGGFGVSYWEEAPSQPRDAHEQHIFALFDRRFDERLKAVHGLVDAMRDDWLPAAIDRKFEERVVGTNMYFAHRDKLVTAGYVREAVGALENEMTRMFQRLVRLERPWWKRWFGR